MSKLEQRLQALEEMARPNRGVRYFTGYETEDRYYEGHPVRRDTEDEGYYTRADIAKLEAEGWECNIIEIRHVEDWWLGVDVPLAVISPGMIEALL